MSPRYSLDPVCRVDPSVYIGRKDLAESLKLTPGGAVTFGGVDVLSLADEHGTRLNIADLNQIAKNARRLIQSFKAYPIKANLFYAMKANPSQAIVERIVAEDFGIEVINIHELQFALNILKSLPSRNGSRRIVCNGLSKHHVLRPFKESLIETAFRSQSRDGYDVVVNLSSSEEVRFAAKIASKFGGGLRVGIRVNPAIRPKTAEDLATGAGYTRFGVPISNVNEIIREIRDSHGLVKVVQLHCHIGSQISDINTIATPSERSSGALQGMVPAICSKAIELERKLGIHIDQVNVGGGIAVRYVKAKPKDSQQYGEFWPNYDLEGYASRVAGTFTSIYGDQGIDYPEICVEPGRWITANAVALLLTVTDVFDVLGEFRTSLKGSGKWIITDGSAMTDAHDTVLLQQWFEILNVSRIGKPPEESYNIGGIACDSGDVFAWGRDRTGPRMLPSTNKGDILMVLDIGAYQQALSSNYNMLPTAPTYNIK